MTSTILIEIAGVALVVFALREMFHDIFHPTQSGGLSELVGRMISGALRHTRFRPTVGPLALVSVIFAWVVVVTFGFTLIYFPLIPGQISGEATSSGAGAQLLHSLAWSFGALSFRMFDMHVSPNGLKLVVALEGLIGIAMITASVSWLVLLFPALERTRFLVRKTFALVRAKQTSHTKIESDWLVTDMADRVIQARIDLVLFPILLNFYSVDPSHTLARALPHLQQIADEELGGDSSPQLRFAATYLREALLDFCRMLSDRILSAKPESMEAAFRSFIALTD